MHLKGKDFVHWPGKITTAYDHRKPNEYCEFHQDRGHSTSDCKALRYEVIELLKIGHLKEFLSEKGWQTYGLASGIRDKHETSKTPSLLPTKKTMKVILVGSPQTGESYSTVNKSNRKAVLPKLDQLHEVLLEDYIISFHMNETTTLCRTYDDDLVILLWIANC